MPRSSSALSTRPGSDVLDIKEVTVIGAGLMGHGIAEVFALSGLKVNIEDPYPEALDKAKKSIEKSIEKLVKSGKIKKEDAEKTISSISYFDNIPDAVKNSDLILEAVPEIIELKRKIFAELDKHCRPDAIITTNTSNIKISTIAEDMSRPENVVGMHFFNPPVLMKLVEVIKGERTSDAAFEQVYELTKKIGKTPIRVMKDSAGFVVNRINAPESLLFCLILDQNVASPAEVDVFAKGQGLPMGPYELMDYVGIDTVVHSMNYYAEELSRDYGKCRAFRDKMDKGELGLKTGKGFYDWKTGHADIPKADPTAKLELLDVLAVELNEAVKVIEEGISTPADIETGVALGMNRPFGPISVAKGLTNAEIKKKLQTLSEKFGTDVFAPAKSIAEGKLKEIISRETLVTAEKGKEPEKPVAKEVKEAEFITVERPGNKVAKLVISNTKNNLINSGVLEELEATLNDLWMDKEINVIVITGKGDVFSAGAQLTQYFPGGVDFMENARKGERIFRLLSEVPKITIAEMKGYVLGGGFELSLGCDIRVSTEETKIGFPEVTLGLIPGWGGSQRLSKLIGMSRALHYILTAERFTGRDAFEIGLVTKLFSKESIDEETMKFAEDLATRIAPVSAAVAKRLVNKGSEMSMDNGLEMESMAMGLLYGTDDLKEGISAFIGKRKPEFKGR